MGWGVITKRKQAMNDNIERRNKMTKRKWMWCLPLVLMVFLTLSPMAYGDLYWESEATTAGGPTDLPKSLPKQVRDKILAQFKGTSETVKHYLTSRASRTEQKDHIMIINFGTMMMYQLNPGNKTYTEINMMSMMDDKMKEIAKDIQVTPTNETKKIAGYKCKKYNVTVMGVTSEHWLSKKVKGYKEFRKMSKEMEKSFKKNPRLRQMSMAGISSKEGFPVKTVTTVMGMTTTTTLKKIEKKSLSKNLFKVPKGYKLMKLPTPLK
jgi:hypothetical protein